MTHLRSDEPRAPDLGERLKRSRQRVLCPPRDSNHACCCRTACHKPPGCRRARKQRIWQTGCRGKRRQVWQLQQGVHCWCHLAQLLRNALLHQLLLDCPLRR